MNSFDDSDDAVKKAAKAFETEPMCKPEAEPSLVAPLALRSDGKRCSPSRIFKAWLSPGASGGRSWCSPRRRRAAFATD